LAQNEITQPNAVLVSQPLIRADIEAKKTTVEVKEEEKPKEPVIVAEPVVNKNSESNDS